MDCIKSEIIVRNAQEEDIPGILQVLEFNLLNNKKNTTNELESQGFLLHGFTADDLQQALREHEKHIVLVAAENNEILGYVLSYDLESQQPAWIEKIIAGSSLTDEKILYYRHIATKAYKKGLGTLLLHALMQEASKRQYDSIICQIAHTPLKNTRSIMLHEKCGFNEIGFFAEEVGFGVYLKKLIR